MSPGTIGSIGATLGKNGINISRMQVGQDEDSANNIVFLKTDTPLPNNVLMKLRGSPMVIAVTLLYCFP